MRRQRNFRDAAKAVAATHPDQFASDRIINVVTGLQDIAEEKVSAELTSELAPARLSSALCRIYVNQSA
jgi:hypothetical protein